MKCIKTSPKNIEQGGNPNEVIRVTDNVAASSVLSGLYVYASKQEWKEAGRHHSPARKSKRGE